MRAYILERVTKYYAAFSNMSEILGKVVCTLIIDPVNLNKEHIFNISHSVFVLSYSCFPE